MDNTSLEDVRALIDHDTSKVVGRSSNDTLKLTIDDIGLRFSLTLPDTTYARDLYENVRVGNIDNCSFGFSVAKNGDEVRFDKENNIYRRTVKDISKLTEISIVSFPAYQDTDVSVAMRSIEAVNKQEEQRNKELELLKIELDLLKTIYG